VALAYPEDQAASRQRAVGRVEVCADQRGAGALRGTGKGFEPARQGRQIAPPEGELQFDFGRDRRLPGLEAAAR